MEDSPLSITANITGILTFTAAILAFVYVRYHTLQNSMKEVDSIHQSVDATLKETESVLSGQSLAARTNEGFHEGWLRNIVKDLYKTEISILRHILIVRGMKELAKSAPTPGNQDTWIFEPQPTTIEEIRNQQLLAQFRYDAESARHRISDRLPSFLARLIDRSSALLSILCQSWFWVWSLGSTATAI